VRCAYSCVRAAERWCRARQEAKAALKKVKAEKSVARQEAAKAETKPAGLSRAAKAKQEAAEKRVRLRPRPRRWPH